MITFRSNISLLPTAAITHALVFAQLNFSTTFISYFRINTANFMPLRVLFYINMVKWNKSCNLNFFYFSRARWVCHNHRSPSSSRFTRKNKSHRFLSDRFEGSGKKNEIYIFTLDPRWKIFVADVFIQKIFCNIIIILSIVTYFYR